MQTGNLKQKEVNKELKRTDCEQEVFNPTRASEDATNSVYGKGRNQSS
jgi:hypothetical protein